ncbi:MAG: HD domain-containing protein [Thermaerobacter sp.]|nr:HD domain-containing protein [Thermaerobacter sp.]
MDGGRLQLDREGPLTRARVIATLSRALDLGEGEPLGHSLRACWIAMQMANVLVLDADTRHQLFYAVLLKDTGCSATAHHMSSWFGTDDRAAKRDLRMVNWSRWHRAAQFAVHTAARGGSLGRRIRQLAVLGRHGPGAARELVRERCTTGAQLVRRLGWDNLVPDAVLNLDEHWDGSGYPLGLAGPAIPLLARIANLAQQTEIAWSRGGAQVARDVVRARRGTWFDPELAEAFLSISRQPNFFDELAAVRGPEDLDRVAPMEPAGDALSLEAGLVPMAEVFAEIVDRKSPWTEHHSERTALYAGRLAAQMGWEPAVVQETVLSGFYHDLGKLGVSNLILDKPGRLTAEEFRAVQEHPALTAEILSPLSAVGTLNRVAAAAAAHHERLDGSGYHRGLAGADIPAMGTVVAVADVFDALTSARPYKASMTPEEALGLMMPEAGRQLAGDAVEALAELVRSGSVPVAGSGEGVAGVLG